MIRLLYLIRRKIVQTIAPDILERLDKLEEDVRVVSQYLRTISDFASYVKEKDAQADEMYSLLRAASSEAAIPNTDLDTLYKVRRTIEEAPAIGSAEIRQKSNKLGEIDIAIGRLTSNTK